MVELVTSQTEVDQAFWRWTAALVSKATRLGYGWIIEGTGVVFNNYGHGAAGELGDQVMLGADPQFGNGVVKIVRPQTSQLDKGKLTVVGRDADDLVLLRDGWLKKNNLSHAVRTDFAERSGLQPVELHIAGVTSKRAWFKVADLNAAPDVMTSQTADFALACARARLKAGGAKASAQESEGYALALDEKGRVFKVKIRAATREVCALQGYVSESLKAILGDDLTIPTKHGYAVDALIRPANLLVEIKTGVSAHDVYEAVGQLMLYPPLIGLEAGFAPLLLIPDEPALRPALAAALRAAKVEVYTYTVTQARKAPKITFSSAFLARCGRAERRFRD